MRDALSGNTNSQKDENMTRAEKVQAVAEFLSRGKPEDWPQMLAAVPEDPYPPDVIEEAKAKTLALREMS